MTATIPTTVTTASDSVSDLNLTNRRERDQQVNSFKRKYRTAVGLKVRSGKLTHEEADLLCKAMESDKIVKNGRTYASQLFFELYQIAGGVYEDVLEWLQSAVNWMIENWDTVLKVAFTLLMLMV